VTHEPVQGSDEVLDALDALLRAVDVNFESWNRVRERAKSVREQRDRGLRYSEMAIEGEGPAVIEVVAQNQERLTAAAARFRRALARTLAEEGWSYAEIARTFGVSRQRVGSLLKGDEAGGLGSAMPEPADRA
jgi:DNA invertase Pin-like site-specific DNA recombinase